MQTTEHIPVGTTVFYKWDMDMVKKLVIQKVMITSDGVKYVAGGYELITKKIFTNPVAAFA